MLEYWVMEKWNNGFSKILLTEKFKIGNFLYKSTLHYSMYEAKSQASINSIKFNKL